MAQTFELIDNHPLTYLAASADDLPKITKEVQQSGQTLFGTIAVLENGQAKILHDDGTWHNFG